MWASATDTALGRSAGRTPPARRCKGRCMWASATDTTRVAQKDATQRSYPSLFTGELKEGRKVHPLPLAMTHSCRTQF
eukprot:350425-Chlamydomonas_euryale.AAC.3